MPKTINNFSKGQWQDSDAFSQPKGTYWKNLNGRLISKGDGNYAWENIKGNKVAFSLDTGFYPMHINEIRTQNSWQLVVFSKDTVGGTLGAIGTVDISEATITTSPATYYPRYVHSGLNFSLDYGIVSKGYYENSNIRRIHWEDYLNQPRSLNLAELDYVASGSLEIPESYLVVRGSVTYNGVPYTIGTTFLTTIAGGNTYTGTGLVVKYFPIDSLDYSPEFSVGTFVYDELISGQLYGGNYIFCWRLKSAVGGITDWSFLTRPVHIGSYCATGGDEDIYQDKEGIAITEDSQHGIQFYINLQGAESIFDRIEIAAFWSDDYNLASTGYIFFEGPITGSSHLVQYTKHEGDTISVSEVMNSSITILKSYAMTETKHYMIKGNIVEDTEYDWEPIGATITDRLHELPTDDYNTRYTGHSTPRALNGHDSRIIIRVVGPPDEYGWIYPRQWYKVGGTGSINYNGGVVTAGDFFQGAVAAGSAVPTYTINAGVPTVQPYFRIQTHVSTGGTKYYQDIPITDGFLDYKGEVPACYGVGYWRREQYRIGVLIWSKYGKPKYVRWLKDHTVNSIANHPLINGYTVHTVATGSAYDWWNAVVVSLQIDGLDITSIKDDISGISIVRAPRDKVILSEGILRSTVYRDVGTPTEIGMTPNFKACQNTGGAVGLWSTRFPNMYCYYSPEYQFGFDFFNAQENDLLRIEQYLEAEYWEYGPANWSGMGVTENPADSLSMYQRFYIQNLPGGTGKPGGADTWANVDSENEILLSFEMGLDTDGSIVAPSGWASTYYLYGHTDYYDNGSGNWHYAVHGPCQFMVLERDETGGYYTAADGFGMSANNAWTTIDSSIATYVSYRRPKTNLYGGTTDTAKENTEYLFIGHYIPVNSTFLAQIFNAGSGKYVINEMQVFGGDCFICAYDYQRLLRDENASDHYSQAIVFPVQSSVNVSMRNGRHCSRNRTSYNNLISSDGIYYDTGVASSGWRLEDFLYNKAYSTDDIGGHYPALPEDYQFNAEFDFRVRWSQEKIPGEEIDSYRIFPVLNYKDLESGSGPIINLASKFGRLFYWQTDSIGYIPIGERALSENPLGGTVQLGVGGVFDRYDELSYEFGNQHKFALVETKKGFIWLDYKRRTMLEYVVGGNVEMASVIRGMDSYFQNVLPKTLLGYKVDMPHAVAAKGIVGFFDERYRLAMISIFAGTTAGVDMFRTTIVYDTDNRQFVGHFFRDVSATAVTNRFPIIGISHKNFLFTAARTADTGDSKDVRVYVNDCNDYGVFHDETAQDSYLELIINDQNYETKVFDNFEIIGNEDFPSGVEYSNGEKTNLTTDIDQYKLDDVVSASNVLTNRNYERKKQRWYGTFPFGARTYTTPSGATTTKSRSRFEDYPYIRVKFYVRNVRNKLVRILSMITTYRKTY